MQEEKFTILEEFKKGKKYFVKVQWECGNIKNYRKDGFKNKKHCGCKKETQKSKLKIGSKWGRLTVIKNPTGYGGANMKVWCKCECGTEKEFRGYGILNGETKSCGCYMSDCLSGRAGENHPMYKHGKSNSRVYKIWYQRVKNDCIDNWLKFENFFDYIGDVKDEKFAGKLDYEQPYGPDNFILITEEYQKQDASEKLKITSLDKYGVDHYTKTEEFEKQRRATNLKNLGVEYPIQNPDIKEKIRQSNIKSGRIIYVNNKNSHDLAQEKNVSLTTIRKWIRDYGTDIALSMDKSMTHIESVIKIFLEENNIDYIHQRKVGKYIPDFCIDKLIIEVDGVFWHSDKIIEDNNYHVKKRQNYINEGYSSLFFREDEIKYKFDIVKSMILNKLGKSIKIGARKCNMVEVPTGAANDFFHLNHLMGRGSGKCVGLEYNGELISAIRLINRKGYTDISRFANKVGYTIQGGLSKLLKPINGEIRSFVDLRYGNGKSLEQLDFELERCSPSFKWTKGEETIHRMNFPGNSGYDHGYNKIWDCGQALYIKK